MINIDLDKIEANFKKGCQFTLNHVREHDLYFEKTLIKKGLLSPEQESFYKEIYGSVRRGYEACTRKINKNFSKNLIIDFECRSNWYIRYKTRKFPDAYDILPKEKIFSLNSLELYNEFENIEEYTNWFIEQTYRLSYILFPFNSSDYSQGNVFVIKSEYPIIQWHGEWKHTYSMIIIDVDKIYTIARDITPFETIKNLYLCDYLFARDDSVSINQEDLHAIYLKEEEKHSNYVLMYNEKHKNIMANL